MSFVPLNAVAELVCRWARLKNLPNPAAHGFALKPEYDFDDSAVVVPAHHVRRRDKDRFVAEPESGARPVRAWVLGVVERREDDRQGTSSRSLELRHVSQWLQMLAAGPAGHSFNPSCVLSASYWPVDGG